MQRVELKGIYDTLQDWRPQVNLTIVTIRVSKKLGLVDVQVLYQAPYQA